MEQEDQQAQNAPDNHQSGENIVKGANNEDQLNRFKESAPEGGRNVYPDQQAGTPPDAYEYKREESGESTAANDAD
ncbi:hypothetical protein GCM10027037_02580 [Mucilaginibacter koreensis]